MYSVWYTLYNSKPLTKLLKQEGEWDIAKEQMFGRHFGPKRKHRPLTLLPPLWKMSVSEQNSTTVRYPTMGRSLHQQEKSSESRPGNPFPRFQTWAVSSQQWHNSRDSKRLLFPLVATYLQRVRRSLARASVLLFPKRRTAAPSSAARAASLWL